MLDTITYIFNPKWSIGPAVISIFTFLVVFILLISRPTSRGPVGYAALVGSLSGLINYVIIMALALSNTESTEKAYIASFVFYSIYLSFAFVPGIIGFHRISKENGGKLSVIAAYLGYIYAFAVIVVGIVMAIMISNLYVYKRFYIPPFDYMVMISTGEKLVNIIGFIYYSGWGFVAIYFILMGDNRNRISGTPSKTLYVYSALNIIPVIVNTVIANVQPKTEEEALDTLYIVPLILCRITIAFGLIIATYYGNLWRSKSRTIKDSNVEANNSNRVDAEKY